MGRLRNSADIDHGKRQITIVHVSNQGQDHSSRSSRNHSPSSIEPSSSNQPLNLPDIITHSLTKAAGHRAQRQSLILV
ncbi:hypothetical protein NPIL_573001 [Nephila pilipes]|uniref:Uncharacterized protein n=1 Tax=Nephila pilipes TaxID=299642 RepID=A0A8X6I4U3_NEPPI|nr:hypothetical protein NPIL_573001 [Nephila pilipes]